MGWDQGWVMAFPQLQSCNGRDISIQYLPTSCHKIAELNPHSPPGYYKISTTSGSSATVYCYMTAQDNIALSCQDIATQNMTTPSAYYWVKILMELQCMVLWHGETLLQHHRRVDEGNIPQHWLTLPNRVQTDQTFKEIVWKDHQTWKYCMVWHSQFRV